MNNILSPKEWLNYINEKEEREFSIYDCDDIIMERYANYRTMVLQAKILEFRVKLPLYTFLTIQDNYDKHFNITTERNGKN